MKTVRFTFAATRWHEGCDGPPAVELRPTRIEVFDGYDPDLIAFEGEVWVSVAVGDADPIEAIRYAASRIGIAIEREAER